VIPLKLSSYEQSALAELSVAASSVHWTYFGKGEEATQKQLEQFAEVVLRFDKINWGTMYDKLHRSGANS